MIITTLLQCFDAVGWVIRPVNICHPQSYRLSMSSELLLNSADSTPFMCNCTKKLIFPCCFDLRCVMVFLFCAMSLN